LAATTATGRVCVTGGLGFIGSHLARELLERGHRVVCLDWLSGSYARGSGADAAAELERLGARIVVADVMSDAGGAALGAADAVVHLAAIPGVRGTRTFAELWHENALSTARVLEAARGARVLLASTSSVYGDAIRLPAHEALPPSPLNPYALSKVAAESAVAGAAREGADALTVRMFTVYGPGQRPEMAFASWIDALLDERPVSWCAHPETRREFTFVEDAVEGIVAALEHGRPGEAYNLGGADGSVALADALSELEAALGVSARIQLSGPSPAEIVATEACHQKSRRELGYEPVVSLREGVALQVEFTANSTQLTELSTV
jgi:nucleoside-diphosphate-sugar epimerase